MVKKSLKFNLSEQNYYLLKLELYLFHSHDLIYHGSQNNIHFFNL